MRPRATPTRGAERDSNVFLAGGGTLIPNKSSFNVFVAFADAYDTFLAGGAASFSLPGHHRRLEDPLLALDAEQAQGRLRLGPNGALVARVA